MSRYNMELIVKTAARALVGGAVVAESMLDHEAPSREEAMCNALKVIRAPIRELEHRKFDHNESEPVVPGADEVFQSGLSAMTTSSPNCSVFSSQALGGGCAP